MTTIINGSSPSVTFSDNTTQTTAGLPLTGGTITGNVTTSGLTIGTTPIGAGNATRFKNRFINGDMRIAQRANSATVAFGNTVPTSSTGYPCVDRWFVYSAGANVTAAQVAGSGNTQNNLQITGAASVTAVGVGQRIEANNSYDLAGQTVTLSVNMSNSLLTNVTWTASYANTSNTFGTIGTPTKVQISTGTFVVNSTLSQYNTQISIPANATTGVEILFTVGAQTSGTWVIGNAQLEVGSSATGFEYVDYTTQLAMCQRYCQANGGAVSNQILGVAWEYSASGAVVACLLPVVMRTTPSLTYSAVGDWAAFSGGAGGPYNVTAIGLNRASPTSMSVEFTASSLTAGQAGAVLANNTLNARIFLSAEL